MSNRPIILWLSLCWFMVFVMVLLGGVTRLTGSGLSIVEWRPLMGAFPPLSEAAWRELFDQYRAFPEFRKINFWMTLADFKGIFWLEYLHRLWGRLIGLVVFVPFVYFLIRGRLSRSMTPALIGLFILGGMQGLLGWYMVKSGLVDRPEVSHFRLAAHLGLALLIYLWLQWMIMNLAAPDHEPLAHRPGRRYAILVLAWAFVTALAGALVAGLDAGLSYNTFPLMDGRLVPAEITRGGMMLAEMAENAAVVQFVHRLLAVSLVVLCLGLRWRSRAAAPRPVRIASFAGGMAVFQAGLGIVTLLTFVPVPLAAAHQAGALVLLSLILWLIHALRST